MRQIVLPVSLYFGALVVAIQLLCFGPPVAADAWAGEVLDIDCQAQTEKHCFQIELTVEGPLKVISVLQSEDFEISADGRMIEEFTLECLCHRADTAELDRRPRTRIRRANPSCVYLISFDASLLSHTQPIPTSVRVKRQGVSVRIQRAEISLSTDNTN